MRCHKPRWVSWVLLLMAVLCWSTTALPAVADGSISIVEERQENHFPNELIWHLTAHSTAGDITSIKLVFAKRGDTSLTSAPLQFEPAREVAAQHRWHTKYLSVPPGAPILFHWVIRDAVGNERVTEERVLYYDDLRFPWNRLENEQVALFWYEGDNSFGQELFDLANEAVERLSAEIGAQLAFQVRIVVYPGQEEFFSAFPRMRDWIGGRAFPKMGLTVQIISPDSNRDWWQGVIPHEIAHLLFHQATDHPFADPPAWLNEGLAVHSEAVSHDEQESMVRRAARGGELLPLPYVTGSFGPDHAQVSLAYAQSLSMVEYALERFGPEGMAALMVAYREGKPTREAMPATWGMSQEEFYAEWKTATTAAAAEADLRGLGGSPSERTTLLTVGLMVCCCSTSLLVVAAGAAVLLFRN